MKQVLNEPNRLKTAKKSSSTSYQVRAAPESWSKYSTGKSFLKQDRLRSRSLVYVYHSLVVVKRGVGVTGKLGDGEVPCTVLIA